MVTQRINTVSSAEHLPSAMPQVNLAAEDNICICHPPLSVTILHTYAISNNVRLLPQWIGLLDWISLSSFNEDCKVHADTMWGGYSELVGLLVKPYFSHLHHAGHVFTTYLGEYYMVPRGTPCSLSHLLVV